MSCPHPAPTPHGYIEISGFTGEYLAGTRARYHCSPGYQITGPEDSRLCTAGGWTGEVPQCSPLSCGDPPGPAMVPNTEMAVLDATVVTFTCQPGFTTGDPAVTEFQSSCEPSGNWTAVTRRCFREQPEYQFGEDPRKDFLVMIIAGIFLIIAVSSIALASRMIIIRAQTKRGFFLRNPNYQAATPSDPPESLKPLTCLSEEPPPPLLTGTPPRKNSHPVTPKKVSLILKIEEEKKKSSGCPVVQSVVVGGRRPALRYQPAVTVSQQSSPAPVNRYKIQNIFIKISSKYFQVCPAVRDVPELLGPAAARVPDHLRHPQ